MYSFNDGGSWFEQIAEVSTRGEFQTATIRIEDSSLVTQGDYDVETNTYAESSGDPVVYEGQARLIGIRWGTFTGGESQANATTLSAIRVQIPKDGTGRVKRGCKVFVVSSPGNPSLENLWLRVTSDLQGASSAARTFEAALDADTVAQNA